MAAIGKKRGSNLVYCIILVALLGLLAGAYALLLSHNTNSAVSQRKFQQEYLTADSLRQSVVDSIVAEKNSAITDMETEIKGYLRGYADYVTEWNGLTAAERAEREKANDTPAYRLEKIKHKTLVRSGTTTLPDGATLELSMSYRVGDKELTLAAQYAGKESYNLGALLYAGGNGTVTPPVDTGCGIHLGSGDLNYSGIPGIVRLNPLDKQDIDKATKLVFDATGGDVYCQIAMGNNSNFTFDVSKIEVKGNHRVFLVIPAGHKLTLTGTMTDPALATRLFIITETSKKDTLSLTLRDLTFYGQIYMPHADCQVAGTVLVNGTVTVNKELNADKTPPTGITVNEQMGDYSGTGITELGPYWGAANSANTGKTDGSEATPVAGYQELGDLTHWEVKSYYEG